MGATTPLLHLADALNLLWYLVPLWLVGVAAGLAAREPKRTGAAGPAGVGATAWLALVPMAAMVLIVSPGGGWARDWDVAIGPAALASLATAYALIRWWRQAGPGGTAGPVATLALSAAIALWGVTADARISHRRIEALLEGRPALGDATRAGAYDLLGARALSAGDAERAVTMFTRAIDASPNPRYYYQLGMAEEVAGRIDRAEQGYRRAAGLMPAMPDPWVGLVRTALVRGDSLSARAYAESALARDPRGSDPSRVRAILAQRRLAPATAGPGR
jgi:tetratricopeptide (TPR) repeat protein